MKNMWAARSMLAIRVGARRAILAGAATLAMWCSIVMLDHRFGDATNAISGIRTIGETLVTSVYRLR